MLIIPTFFHGIRPSKPHTGSRIVYFRTRVGARFDPSVLKIGQGRSATSKCHLLPDVRFLTRLYSVLVLFPSTRLDRGFSIGTIIKPLLAFNRYIPLIHPQFPETKLLFSRINSPNAIYLLFAFHRITLDPSLLSMAESTATYLLAQLMVLPTPYLNLSAQANLPSGTSDNNKQRPGSGSHEQSRGSKNNKPLLLVPS
jgi:hypothetical protein